jgi:hypothetical protein
MKVVRLQGGHRITCTDSEFAALSLMVDIGRENAIDPKNHTQLPGMAKKAIRREPFTSPEGPLKITDDRRA